AVQVFDEKLSVRETEKLIKKLNAPVKQKVEEKDDEQTRILYQDLEEKLKTKMGTKVNISRKADGKGKIEIEYYSGDELDRLIGFLMER
ncbi:MAG: chromosome partitioning protein ParB, partial [Lachnospiraceae bacterium]|nr:chromosome partitioning protein ParB [Lachnospiraceae bacterium]